MKLLFQSIKVPFFLIVLLIVIEILSRYGIIPSVEEFSNYIGELMSKYGLLVIGPLSFFENIGGLNVYFPGSLVILTAMAVTGGDPIRGLFTYLTIYSFAFLAYHVNFYIGKRFKSKGIDRSTEKENQLSLWIQFLSTFWHPHFAAITCIRLGNFDYKYIEIFKYLLVSSFIWNTFWGLLMYNLGVFFDVTSNINWLVYAYLIGWLLLEFYRYIAKNNKITTL